MAVKPEARTRRDRADRQIKVVVTHGSDGWWLAEAPRIRGAYTQGRTEASARRNLESLIADLRKMRAARGA